MLWYCGIKDGVDELQAELVGARYPGPAAFPGVEEGVLVHLPCRCIMDDETPLDPMIVRLEPCVDPERDHPDQLLLLVTHRARDVHHVDDDGVGVRLFPGLPRPVAPVLFEGPYIGICSVRRTRIRVVAEGRDDRSSLRDGGPPVPGKRCPCTGPLGR